MDLHGVGFYFIYYFSYLLREAMCSSERPPSPSSTMNNLSLSSLGCTGKLFRKISVKRLEGWGKEKLFFLLSHRRTLIHPCYAHKHTHIEKHFFWQKIFWLVMNLASKKSPKYNYLCIQVLPANWFTLNQIWTDENFVLPNNLGLVYIWSRDRSWIFWAAAPSEQVRQKHSLRMKQLCFALAVPGPGIRSSQAV